MLQKEWSSFPTMISWVVQGDRQLLLPWDKNLHGQFDSALP
jgi:hypothetical protein